MNPHKISVIALVIGASAIALNVATTAFYSITSSSKLDTAQAELSRLAYEHEVTKQQLVQNRAMLSELDTGLTAIASVLKVDAAQLRAAIVAVKEVNAQSAAAETAQAALELSTAAEQPVSAERSDPESSGENLFALDEAEAQSKKKSELSDDGAPVLSVIVGNTEPQVMPKATIEKVDGILGQRISQSWFKPSDAKDDLSAVLQLKMSRDGKVISAAIIKASGHKKFDASVIEAVNNIGQIEQVSHLSDEDYARAYESRHIQFTPAMGR